MWSAYTWVLMAALVAADIEWTTDIGTGKKYTIQVAPNDGTKATSQEYCKKIGGMLPEPKNKDENDFIQKLIRTRWIDGGDIDDPFLGIHFYNELDYFDNDNSLVCWSNFNGWESAVSKTCVDIDKHEGYWDRKDCNFVQRKGKQFVCEKAPITQPNPGIAWNTDIRTGKKYVTQIAPDGGTKATFQEACKKIGGIVPEPKNKMENDFVEEMLRSITKGGYGTFFIGVHAYDDVDYYDTDNTPVSWANWFGWESSAINTCVDIDQYEGYWGRQDCNLWQRHGLQFLCEKASEDEPITTTRRRQAISTTTTGDWITHPSSGKKYKVLKSQWKPPDGNQEACKNIGAKVAEPRSKDENDFLATLQPATFRLGMSDKAIEGVWTWDSDDSQVVWFNWMQWAQDKNSEPNGGLQENCSVMVQYAINAAILANTGQDQKGWLDVDCASPLGTEVIICEKVEPEEAGDVVVVEYQLTVTIELNITNDDILNTGSEAFIVFAIEVSQVMLKNYQSVNPAVVKVKVTGVRRGSAIVDHNVGVKSANDTSTDEIIATVVKESASLPIVINGTSYKQTLVNKGRISFAKTSGCGQLHPPAILLSVVLGFCQLLRCLSG